MFNRPLWPVFIFPSHSARRLTLLTRTYTCCVSCGNRAACSGMWDEEPFPFFSAVMKTRLVSPALFVCWSPTTSTFHFAKWRRVRLEFLLFPCDCWMREFVCLLRMKGMRRLSWFLVNIKKKLLFQHEEDGFYAKMKMLIIHFTFFYEK